MSVLGNLIVRITGDNKELKNALTGSKKQLSGFGAAVKKHSATFMKTGAVMMGFAGAIGIAAVKIGKEFDKAYSKIRTGTGKTGKVLEGLKKDFKAVVKGVPNSFDEVSATIADLNTRLGLSGKPLQDMAKRMLNLARITETDVNAVVRTSTRLFGDWGIAVEDQAETLDYLYKVSQSTGVGIDRLSDLTTTYGVQLRTVGFTLEESLALMGKWEKEGVATEKMLGGLSMALGKFAKAQKEPEEAFRQLVSQIEEATTVGKAMEIGVEALGTRAGPDFALAVREGRFAVEDFVEELAGSSETINQAAEDTMTLTEKFNLLKNQAKLAVEPLSKKLMDELAPAIEKVTDKLSDLDEKTLDNIASGILWTGKIMLIGGAFIFAMGAIGKFTVAIKTARTALLGMHAAAWGPIALVLLPAIAGGIAKISHESTEAEDRISDMDSAIQDTIFNLGTFQGRLSEGGKELVNTLESLRELAEVYPEISESIVQLAIDFDQGKISEQEYLEELLKIKNEYGELPDAILGVSNMEQGWIETTEQATEVAAANAEVLAELKRQLNANEISQGEYDAAVKAATEATESQTGAFEDDAEAADSLSDEIDTLRGSFNKLLGVLFDGINANNEFQESGWALSAAQEEVNRLAGEGKEGTEEYGEAVNKLDGQLQDYITAAYEVYTSTFTTREEQREAKEEALKYGKQMVETGQWGEESFVKLAEQFGTTAEGITTNIYGLGGIMPGYQAMYDKGVELDEQEIEPEIDADNKPAMDAIQAVIDKTIPDKHFTIYAHTSGGIVGFAGGGIVGSDGFSLPVITAAKGLITPSFDNGGILALLHKKEVVLNSGQQLNLAKLIFGLAEGKYGVSGGGGTIHIHNEYNEELASKTFARLFAQYVGEINR